MHTSIAAHIAPTLLRAASTEGHGATAKPMAEIVTFRLVPGTDSAEFVAAADALGPFLRSTGALVHRTLSVDGDGLWTDHILWTSGDAAKQASNDMFERPEAKPFLAMIAQDGNLMRYAPVQMQQE